MRLYTENKRLIDLLDVPFSRKMFDLLTDLATRAPNVAMQAREVHSGRTVIVKLYQLDLEWRDVQVVNPSPPSA